MSSRRTTSPPTAAIISDGPQKLALSIDEATIAASLSRASLYRAIADKRLIARKAGARTVILVGDLRDFLAGLPPM